MVWLVWYGIVMVWFGMVGMVWYSNGLVWYGWYGMVWLVWYGMVWYGMVWYGMVWYGMVWYGMVWYGMVWYGMVWYGMVWYGHYLGYKLQPGNMLRDLSIVTCALRASLSFLMSSMIRSDCCRMVCNRISRTWLNKVQVINLHYNNTYVTRTPIQITQTS